MTVEASRIPTEAWVLPRPRKDCYVGSFPPADLRDLERASAAIDRIEKRHGECFHDYAFDSISRVRAAAWEAINEMEQL